MNNIVSLFGLRHHKRSTWHWIIINRLLHKLGKHWCICGNVVRLGDCYGVIDNDTLICDNCFFRNLEDTLASQDK